MKTIILLLSVLVLASCRTKSKVTITKESSTYMPTVYWIGGDGVVVIKDTTGKETYEPFQLKHASKKQLKKLDSISYIPR